MTDGGELLELALRCRLLAARCDDDATVRSLDRLADDYERRAQVADYLAQCAWLRPAAPGGIGHPAARAAGPATTGNSAAPRA